MADAVEDDFTVQEWILSRVGPLMRWKIIPSGGWSRVPDDGGRCWIDK